ncbi:MAG: hypothetical protein NTW73_00265 [Candidatus Parcubacteria bacterium]|nr:hypothetical protein [Candidatus Parcubacteria bacterium]
MGKITLKKIAEMSDEEVFNLSIPRPLHPEQRGFMLPLQDSDEEMAECMCVLIKRLSKIKKEN